MFWKKKKIGYPVDFKSLSSLVSAQMYDGVIINPMQVPIKWHRIKSYWMLLRDKKCFTEIFFRPGFEWVVPTSFFFPIKSHVSENAAPVQLHSFSLTWVRLVKSCQVPSSLFDLTKNLKTCQVPSTWHRCQVKFLAEIWLDKTWPVVSWALGGSTQIIIGRVSVV